MSRRALGVGLFPAISKSSLFCLDAKGYETYLGIIFEMLKFADEVRQSTDISRIARILIDINTKLSGLPYKNVVQNIEKSANGPWAFEKVFVKSLMRLASELSSVLSEPSSVLSDPSKIQSLLTDDLLIELKQAMPLIFKNFIRFYLEENIVSENKRGRGYLEDAYYNIQVTLKADELSYIAPDKRADLQKKLLKNFLDIKKSDKQEQLETAEFEKKLVGDAMKILSPHTLDIADVSKLNKKLTVYGHILQIDKVDVTGIKLEKLLEFYESYKKTNIVAVLKSIERRLCLASQKFEVACAIADFTGYVIDRSSQELSQRIQTLITTRYFTMFRYFRNGVMHSLDDKSLIDRVVKSEFDIVRRYAIVFIQYLQMPGNLHYLKTGAYAAVEFFQFSFEHETRLRSIQNIIKLPGIRSAPLDSAQQLDLFIEAIDISIAILEHFCSQVQADFTRGIAIGKITDLMAKSDHDLGNNDLKIKMTYDLLVQALGQALGNLQDYETFSNFRDMRISAEDFKVLHKIVPLAKDFRSLRTHQGCYRITAFQAVLTRAFQCNSNSELVVVCELHQLRKRYLDEQHESRRYNQLSCSIM